MGYTWVRGEQSASHNEEERPMTKAINKQATKKAAPAKAPKTEVEATETEAKEKPRMANQLSKAKERYQPCVTHRNTLSLNNGDSVAGVLAAAEPLAVVGAAELLCGFKSGELVEKYSKLNNGQKRMNAGNRIRSMHKKGEITTDQIAKALV